MKGKVARYSYKGDWVYIINGRLNDMDGCAYAEKVIYNVRFPGRRPGETSSGEKVHCTQQKERACNGYFSVQVKVDQFYSICTFFLSIPQCIRIEALVK